MTDGDKIVRVVAEEDFIEKLTVAGPTQALAELIWNGLDAEATKVSVELDNSLLGLRAIRVRDNGHGIQPQDAEEVFIHLGGSWKRSANKSKNGKRVLHGKEGKGRFRALALGRVAMVGASEKMDAGYGIRQDNPEVYEAMQDTPLFNTLYIIDPDQGCSINQFTVDCTNV
jgi:Histidine kinase-, DNA gyrase B-, and HSP90-like ATPase